MTLEELREKSRALPLAPGVYLWSARYVLDAALDSEGNATGGTWVETPWRNRAFEVQEVNGQLCR